MSTKGTFKSRGWNLALGEITRPYVSAPVRRTGLRIEKIGCVARGMGNGGTQKERAPGGALERANEPWLLPHALAAHGESGKAQQQPA